MTHNQKIYTRHKTEIFNIIYDIYKNAPVPTNWSILFGFDNPEAEVEYNKKLKEYLEKIEPEFKVKMRELGFILKGDG